MQPVIQVKHAVVRVALNDNAEIIAVSVAGRPRPHPFGGYEGSHLTPWAVFVDTVRRDVIGQDVRTAAKRLRSLVDELDDAGNTDAARLPQARRAMFGAVADQAWALARSAKDSGDPGILQQAIAAYLTARNLAPLSAAFLGPDKARGRGEAALLRAMRRYESGEEDYDDDTLCEKLLDLMDLEALNFVGTGPADANTAPGIMADRRLSALDVVVRHLREVSFAYPLAHEDSGLDDPAVLSVYFPELNIPTTFSLPTVEYEWDEAPDDWSLSGGQLCLVNLKVRADSGGQPAVKAIEFEGRGNTLLNTQGHHVTAHIAIEEAVRRQLAGNRLGPALTNLVGLAQALPALANWPAAAALPGQVDPKGIFARAYTAFTAALTQAQDVLADNGAGPADAVLAIEDLAGAYVMMRNALPMAAIQYGSTADSKSEGHAMRLIRDWRSKKRAINPNEVCWILWRLLDANAMATLYTDNNRLNEWAPGAPANADQRVFTVLSVHLATIEAAFPELASAASLRSVSSVTWALGQKGLGFPPALTGLLKLSTAQVKPVSPFKTTRRKADDDDEWGSQRGRR